MFAGPQANLTSFVPPTVSASPVSTALRQTRNATAFRTVVLAGDPAPVELGGAFTQIESASIADSGDVVFSAALSGGSTASAIIINSAIETRVLLKAGDAAPGGGTFSRFRTVDVARLNWMGKDGLFVFFNADIEGGGSGGLFVWTPQAIEPVALIGGKSARGQTFESFEQLKINATTRNDGPGFQLAFVARVSGGQKAAIFKTSNSPSEQNLSAGDTISVIGGGLDRIFNLEISPVGLSTVACLLDVQRVNKPSKIYRRLISFGEVTFWFGNWQEGKKIRGAGQIKRILDSPAITFQSVVAAVELSHKRQAITGFGGLLVETKRRAPGLPGRTIREIGPPITNPRVPVLSFGDDPPFGLASKILLDDDTEALWVFDGSSEGDEARIELLDGTTGGGFSIRSFSPLKFSNSGSLLLAGTVADGGDRAGLFVLEGLFQGQN
jgi:hypothetical protein